MSLARRSTITRRRLSSAPAAVAGTLELSGEGRVFLEAALERAFGVEV
jgi:hypothetical protein